MYHVKGLVIRNIHVNMKCLPLMVSKLRPILKFFSKVGQISRSRSQALNLWYCVKGLVIRNTHVFVHATDADANGDADTRAMTLATRTFIPAR